MFSRTTRAYSSSGGKANRILTETNSKRKKSSIATCSCASRTSLFSRNGSTTSRAGRRSKYLNPSRDNKRWSDGVLGKSKTPSFQVSAQSVVSRAYKGLWPFRKGNGLWDNLSRTSSHLSFLQNFLFNLGRIAEIDAVRKTHVVGASRIEPVRHPLVTEVAFLGLPGVCV